VIQYNWNQPTSASKEILNVSNIYNHSFAVPDSVGKKLTPPPPGLDQPTVRGLSDSRIYKAITLGFGRMPPFRDKLSPEERWNLVNFLRTRK